MLYRTLAASLLLILAIPANTQENKESPMDYGFQLGQSRWTIDYYLIHPSVGVYYDLSTNQEVDDQRHALETDLYKKSSVLFSLNMVGCDLLYGHGNLRVGATTFFGGVLDSDGHSKTGVFGSYNAGLVADYKSLFRLEFGWTLGMIATRDLSDFTDQAMYLTVSLPTNLSGKLKEMGKE